jgi:hypothetical protein
MDERCCEMKNILFRLLVAAALTLAALALSSSAHGQQADQDATPTNSGAQGKSPQAAVRPDMQSPASNPHSRMEGPGLPN